MAEGHDYMFTPLANFHGLWYLYFRFTTNVIMIYIYILMIRTNNVNVDSNCEDGLSCVAPSQNHKTSLLHVCSMGLMQWVLHAFWGSPVPSAVWQCGCGGPGYRPPCVAALGAYGICPL